MRMTVRRKLLFFSIALAIMPLAIAGRTMIQITREELKQSANSELINTANSIEAEINNRFDNVWIAPLNLLRNAIDDPKLGVPEKISLLKSAIEVIPGLVACQLTVEGQTDNPVILYGSFLDSLLAAGLDGRETLRLDAAALGSFDDDNIRVGQLQFVPDANEWLIPIVLPLANPLLNERALFSAQIRLRGLENYVSSHPFTQVGTITLVEDDGRQIFDPQRRQLRQFAIVEDAIGLLKSESRTNIIQPYDRGQGDVRLGGFAFPKWVRWAIIVELAEKDAYLAVSRMQKSLLIWIVAGLALAVLGGIIFALRISRPILAISRVAKEVSTGNLTVRVEGVNTRDEIGDLANIMNEMITGLLERFHLEKFVSTETVEAVRGSAAEGVKLGGERKTVTVFFSDIRGFTAFSEKVEPEEVVEMLNICLRRQADLVNEFGGDIDKFVGDELVAVFHGDDMVVRAVECAMAIQEEMARLQEKHPHWNVAVGIGINAGEVVMGAIGSPDRMDFTMLGDNVNLGARLCSAAGRDQILLSDRAAKYLSGWHGGRLAALEPIKVKGKDRAIPIFEVKAKT